jgi:hypothetical protein
MILFNKLVRTDLLLLIALVLLFVIQGEKWKSFYGGICAIVFLISIGLHIQHYKLTKKLY